MLHRGIRFTHAAILVLSVILAFLFVRGLDERDILGSTALVDVADSDNSTNAAEVVRAIKSFSVERGVGVAREVSDLRNPDSVRHLYLAPGNSNSVTADWLGKGYPAFSRNFDTRVHSISEIGLQDPRGQYYVFGSPADADALVTKFHDLGLTAYISHPLSFAEISDKYSGDPLFRAFIVIALAALTMTGASVLLSAKAYGVLRMQGLSFIGILLRDLRQAAMFWLAAASIVEGATLAFVGIYNSFAWLGMFTFVAAVAATLLTVLVLITHAAVLALTSKVDVLSALKGELPSRAASISIYLVRIPTLLLALSIATNVTLSGRDVLTRQENQDIYRTAGDAVSIRLNGAYAMHMDQLDKHVGPWLRRADKQGEVIIAGRRDLQVSAPGEHLPPGEFLIVNDTYLSKQSVLDPGGRRYAWAAPSGKAPDSRPVRVIIPDGLAAHASAITKAASEILDPGRSRHVPLEVLRGKTGQRLFGFNTGSYSYNAAYSAGEDRSLVRDPILVVVPNGSHFFTDDAYTSIASQAGVIFPNPDDVLSGIKAENLQTYLNSMSPVGQKAALDLRDATNKLRLQIFNLIVSMIVLLVAGIGICIIYSRKNAQRIFAQHISGWRYVAIHRFVLSVEVAIAVIFATRIPFEAWRQNKELKKFATAGAPAPLSPFTSPRLTFVLSPALWFSNSGPFSSLLASFTHVS